MSMLRWVLRLLVYAFTHPFAVFRGNDGLTGGERFVYAARYDAGPGKLPDPNPERVDQLFELAAKGPGRTWQRPSSARSDAKTA